MVNFHFRPLFALLVFLIVQLMVMLKRNPDSPAWLLTHRKTLWFASVLHNAAGASIIKLLCDVEEVAWNAIMPKNVPELIFSYPIKGPLALDETDVQAKGVCHSALCSNCLNSFLLPHQEHSAEDLIWYWRREHHSVIVTKRRITFLGIFGPESFPPVIRQGFTLIKSLTADIQNVL